MIRLQKVCKVYKLYERPSDRLIDLISGGLFRKHKEFWALRNVSMNACRGETVGIVGPNGSGKSTLLQVASGIVQPTSGRVSSEGRIAALLELGAGFNPEFTGRDNVLLSAEVLGVSRQEAAEMLPRIEDFAEIGSFFNRPVKEYSSGMYVRLAFSTAIHVHPQILIVDEALAVGDAIFANRCIRKLELLKDTGMTILFVSHDLGLVKRLCDRATLMYQGRILESGSPVDVVNRYVGLVHDLQSAASGSSGLSELNRHGDKASSIQRVCVSNAAGEEGVVRSGESITIEVTAQANRTLVNCLVGVLIRNRIGVDVFGTNTKLEGTVISCVEEGEIFIIRFTVPCVLARGEYTVTAATQNEDGSSQDWVDDAIEFSVFDQRTGSGVLSLKAHVTFEVRHEKLRAQHKQEVPQS